MDRQVKKEEVPSYDIVEEKIGARMSEGERERVLVPAMAELREMTDYQSVGGGLVLGLNGVSAIAHGRSTAKAMVSMIELAKWAVESALVSAIREGCQSFGWRPAYSLCDQKVHKKSRGNNECRQRGKPFELCWT